MSIVPKIIFIVPYRNRPQHKFFFSNYISTILKDRNDYEIYFSHQCDARSFNRGGTKNIGFLAIKHKYPNDYKNITFVFNDVDTIPFTNLFDYATVQGTVKHFYGFKYALGGIVSINGGDFEAINGYPNFWGWGMEDNVLQTRCDKMGLNIDRSQFFPIGNPNILQLFDGVTRIINRKDPWRAQHDDGIDGIKTIYKLNYTIDSESSNPLDNIHNILMNNLFIINITTFMTTTTFENDKYYKYDLREPKRKIIHPDRIGTNKIETLVDDWSHIPFYPTSEKKQEMIKQYGEKTTNEIIQYSYNNSTDPTKEIIPSSMLSSMPPHPPNVNVHQLKLLQIQHYNEAMKKINSANRIVPPNVNKFSPAYSRIIASKTKATTSANVRLGGVYH